FSFHVDLDTPHLPSFPTRRSSDLALEQKLAAFESARGSQLALLLVATTEPEPIEQYSIRVVDEWKLGRHKVDDGALLIIARNDRSEERRVGKEWRWRRSAECQDR